MTLSSSFQRTRRGVGFAVLCLFASACGLVAAPGPVTIIDTATGCDATTERTNLAALLTAAGNTVTTITTGVVPGSLTGEMQVWDIRCQNVLTAPEITTYTNYLAGGGSLFLMGENVGFGAARDASLISFIATMGGGSLTLTPSAASPLTQTVLSPFNAPNALTTVAFRAVGGTTTRGTGSFVTVDSNGYGGAIAFSPGSLSAATAGTLIIVWDVNFLDSAGTHTAAETTLTQNLIAFLAAPAPIPPPNDVPTLSEWALLLLACGLVLVAAWAMRERQATA